MKFSERVSIERRVFFYLCGFALSSSLSLAGSSIFVGLASAGVLHRLWRYRGDAGAVLRKERRFFILLGLFLLTLLLSVPFSLSPWKGIQAFLNYDVYRMMPFVAVLFCIRSRKQICILTMLLFLSVFINDCIGIYQGVKALPGLPRSSGALFYMHQASLLAVMVPVSAFFAFFLKNNLYRLGAGACFVISEIALLFNGTRGAWVAVGVTLLVIALMMVRNKFFLVAGILVVTLVLPFGMMRIAPGFSARVMSISNMEEQSHAERLLLWQSALQMVEDHPATGVGLAQFKQNYQQHYISPLAKEPELGHAHNNILHFFAECGILGGGMFLLLWGYLLGHAVKGWYKSRNPGYAVIVALVLGVMLHGMTEYTYGSSVAMKFFWLVLGLCFVWIHQDEVEKAAGDFD